MKPNSKMTNADLLQHLQTLNALGRLALPIGGTLAENINAMQEIAAVFKKEQQKIITKYAKVNPQGKLLGKHKDGSATERHEIPENANYSLKILEVSDQKKFDDAINALSNKEVKFDWITVSPKKLVCVTRNTQFTGKDGVVTPSQIDVDTPIMDVLQDKLPALTLAYLLQTIVRE